MLKNSIMIGLVLILLIISCSSVTNNFIPSAIYKVKGSEDIYIENLQISTRINNYLSSEYFGVIDFVFENKSNEWMVLKDLRISSMVEEIDSNMKLTMGEDLNIWYESTLRQKMIEDRSDANIRSAFAALGLAMLVSSDDNVKAGGMSVMSAAVASQHISNINMRYNLSTQIKFPEKHLLSGEIRIPPGLSVTRWVVLNTDNQKVKVFIIKMALSFNNDKGDSLQAICILRNFRQKAVWQSEIQETKEFRVN